MDAKKKEIIVFRRDERAIIASIKEILEEQKQTNELKSIENNVIALNELARSISLYPSILGDQHLGSVKRSAQTLVENLCITDVIDLIMNIPTKAILGQGFAIAKINFFFMLLYLSREIDILRETEETIYAIITRNIFTIMAEEVYISLLSDKMIPLEIRSKAGYNLANIWENRIDCGVKEFAPILSTMWNARKKLKPAFGTMLGISEIFMLSENSDTTWIGFFERDELSEDEILSLQEFLMGLSFEEMDFLSDEMEKSDRTSIGIDEIDKILGEKKIHPHYTYEDPREIFHSFKVRKKNSKVRSKTNSKGPKKTVEDYIMIYLLSHQKM